MLSEADVVR